MNSTGLRLVAGLMNGDVHVYDCSEDKLKHLTKIECRNKIGKYSKGAKVTGIEFFSSKMENCAMITTNDSRIRFLNTKSGAVLLKTKGHKNEHFVIKGSLSPDYKYAICASEDG